MKRVRARLVDTAAQIPTRIANWIVGVGSGPKIDQNDQHRGGPAPYEAHRDMPERCGYAKRRAQRFRSPHHFVPTGVFGYRQVLKEAGAGHAKHILKGNMLHPGVGPLVLRLRFVREGQARPIVTNAATSLPVVSRYSRFCLPGVWRLAVLVCGTCIIVR